MLSQPLLIRASCFQGEQILRWCLPVHQSRNIYYIFLLCRLQWPIAGRCAAPLRSCTHGRLGYIRGMSMSHRSSFPFGAQRRSQDSPHPGVWNSNNRLIKVGTQDVAQEWNTRFFPKDKDWHLGFSAMSPLPHQAYLILWPDLPAHLLPTDRLRALTWKSVAFHPHLLNGN